MHNGVSTPSLSYSNRGKCFCRQTYNGLVPKDFHPWFCQLTAEIPQLTYRQSRIDPPSPPLPSFPASSSLFLWSRPPRPLKPKWDHLDLIPKITETFLQVKTEYLPIISPTHSSGSSGYDRKTTMSNSYHPNGSKMKKEQKKRKKKD